MLAHACIPFNTAQYGIRLCDTDTAVLTSFQNIDYSEDQTSLNLCKKRKIY